MKQISLALLLLLSIQQATAQPKMVDSTNYHYNAPQMGDYITFRILFEFSLRLRPDALQVLDLYIVPVLKQNPEIKFQIEYHTDCRATAEFNRDYSPRFADSLRAYIISQGIDSSQIIAKGMGEDDLLLKKCDCDLRDYNYKCTETEHQLNRRAILRIIGLVEEEN